MCYNSDFYPKQHLMIKCLKSGHELREFLFRKDLHQQCYGAQLLFVLDKHVGCRQAETCGRWEIWHSTLRMQEIRLAADHYQAASGLVCNTRLWLGNKCEAQHKVWGSLMFKVSWRVKGRLKILNLNKYRRVSSLSEDSITWILGEHGYKLY